MDFKKYIPFPQVKTAIRDWPSKVVTKSPIWCSVDLRDGNQALELPMTLEQKVEFFSFLVKLGFKEIEVGFPAASETEFEFTRKLIEENRIPDDVTIQVLTQSRRHIIERTFESLAGVKNAIVHLYNSTSTLQRDVVFGKTKEEIKKIATTGAETLVELAEKYGKERFRFEYSPESFTGTELDYALEVSNAVIGILKPTKENPLILNLPSTVEMATPNIYADQIEYMHKNLNSRESVLISLHTHNDRGTAVAAAELGLLAGADRVEGTLFGNGERTGNSDILTLALNLYSQGVDPLLDFSRIDEVIEIAERTTRLAVHPRHPYAGDLVYTAFSGSHQDAINKGMARMKEKPSVWAVPYLPIDPMDVGRNYDPIIRINSQSGKGGVAYLLEANFGLIIPKQMQIDFGAIVTKVTDKNSKEMVAGELYELFNEEYVNITSPIELIKYKEEMNGTSKVVSTIMYKGVSQEIKGEGGGVVDAFLNAITTVTGVSYEVESYNEHATEQGTKAKAITYVKIKDGKGKSFYGAGVSGSITKSSLRALVSAVNKGFKVM